ncbi:MAG: cyclic nucleotide-binding domain-containing protein [Deltaproteobacteria bacterium]|nr:cyclic nucleotide-binding domain-containing protein [Deltaproteobacteria bacterium]
MSAPLSPETLQAEIDHALAEGRPLDAIAYLAELCITSPENRHLRTALAIALGDAGNPAGALKALRALADRLAHQGYLLPAMVIVRHGLEHAPDDATLLATLKRLHVRGVRAKAGNLPTPPPLKTQLQTSQGATANELLALQKAERLERVAQIACDLGPSQNPAIPLPMPLFCELDQEGFIETVKRLRYRRLAAGSKIMSEGAKGDSLVIIVSGHALVQKGEITLATVGAGVVLGEMAIITGALRTATVIAKEEIEIFELTRADVEKLALEKPKIAEELVNYARKRLLSNLLRTSALFAHFNDETRYSLLDRFSRIGFNPGTKIINQGTPGQGLYVIATGEVEVSVAKDDGDSVVVANLGPGEVVGEIALLHDQPTTATVTARGNVGALFLPRDEFQQVVSANPEVREYLSSLSNDRLAASRAAATTTEVLDADDLIVL